MKAFNENAHFFVAFPIADLVKEKLNELSEKLKLQLPYKNWTHQADFHITSSFLGEAKREQIKQLDQNLLKLQNQIPPFSLQLDTLGYFGNKTKPRVLWVGVKPCKTLFQCQSLVENYVSLAHFLVEKRPYRPHITIGKRWSGVEEVDLERVFSTIEIGQPITWDVSQVILYQINLGKLPKYEPIGRYDLKG